MQKLGHDGEETTTEEARTPPHRRIVVGVDASEESKAALRWAARDVQESAQTSMSSMHGMWWMNTPGCKVCLRLPIRRISLVRHSCTWSMKW